MMKPLMTKKMSTPDAPNEIAQLGNMWGETANDSSNEWCRTTSVAAIPRSI
jgi:hypothetical protein